MDSQEQIERTKNNHQKEVVKAPAKADYEKKNRKDP